MINGAKKIIDILNKNGHKAYMIGGCVRDIIMNNIPYDYDITTSATPDEVTKIFNKTIPTGLKHGTVTVIMDDNKYEVTTFRIDGNYADNRRPLDVKFSKELIEDVKRRDFTINSIAFSDSEGFIDYFNGIDDIKNKIIRTVNNPYERFTEDALRILRGIRFASKFNFETEKETLDAMTKLMHLVKNISGERIFDELFKMFSSSPFTAVNLLLKTGFFKEFNLDLNVDNIDKINKLNIKSFETVFSLIVINNSKASDFLNRLKCSNKTKIAIKKIYSSFDYRKETKEELKRMIYELNCENEMDEIISIHKALEGSGCNVEDLYKEILRNDECFLIKALKVNGNDLIELGAEGKFIGKVLCELLYLVIKDPALNKEELLKNKAKELLKIL